MTGPTQAWFMGLLLCPALFTTVPLRSESSSLSDPIQPAVFRALKQRITRPVAFPYERNPYQRGRQGTPPGQPAITFVDPPPLPESLRAVWDTTPLVVHGTVLSSAKPRAVGQNGLVGRNHTVRILEVLKSSLVNPVGTSVLVRQLGGTVTAGDREISTTFPEMVLSEGQEYILFLSRSSEPAVFEIAYGSTIAFPIDPVDRSAKVSKSLSNRMIELKGRTSIADQDLLTLIRSFRNHQ